MRRLALPTAALLALSLVGCAGLSLPTPSAPEPSESYPTISSDEVTSEQCRAAVDQLNGLSKTMAQLKESLDKGDVFQLIGLIDQAKTQLSDLGQGIEGDAELQAHFEDLRATAEALTGKLSNIDTEDPLASLQDMQTELAALQQQIEAVTAYCTS
ncbi:hypothetical protein [Agrococcus casei]|uniref:Lipoprotein n=1 Tax=Agrococcus casei LMG 22410 TaxID=1255656 RepID=A0A1R4G690_9MICO|nr:hypothetical protein [Agrococcus casei]SJM63669.1 hypothetical protein CZ674_09180 [Agrococcus casei LMG 22410]